MKLTSAEHAIVSAITRQYRQRHAGAGRREIMDTFNRARATVLEVRRNTLDCSPEFNRLNFVPVEYLDKKGEIPTFVWKKTPPRR